MKLWEKIKKYLFPPKCVFCRKVLEKDGICEKCRKEIPYRKNAEIKEPARFIDGAYAELSYEDDVRNAIIRYKFAGLSKYSVDFSEFISKCINENLKGEYDIISWIPLNRKRKKSRGYDQAYLLAKETCKRLDDKPIKTLIKSRNAAPQSRQKDPSKRVANVLGAYDLAEVDVTGKRIILIDDVYTTGSTASECARVLKTAGAEKVYVVTIAYTKSRKKELKNQKNRL